MKTAEDFAKEWVLEKCGRMPETEEEINQYLDLINHINEYLKSLRIQKMIGTSFMKKLGFKTPEEIKKEFKF